MPITLEQAKKLGHGDNVHHDQLKNADGTPKRFRVSGMVKTWKRNINRIRVPLKHGLYDNGYLINAESHTGWEGNGFNFDISHVSLGCGC